MKVVMNNFGKIEGEIRELKGEGHGVKGHMC